MSNDFTKREVEVLIEQIVRDNPGYPLTPAMVTFGTPYVFTPTDRIPRNTSIVATAIEGAGYEGSTTFYYNRVALTDFVDWGVTDLTFVVDGERFFSDLLPQINARLNIRLDPERMFDEPLPDFSPGQPQAVDVTITARPDSLCYIGSLTIRVVNSGIELEDVILDTALDGLEYVPNIVITIW